MDRFEIKCNKLNFVDVVYLDLLNRLKLCSKTYYYLYFNLDEKIIEEI